MCFEQILNVCSVVKMYLEIKQKDNGSAIYNRFVVLKLPGLNDGIILSNI